MKKTVAAIFFIFAGINVWAQALSWDVKLLYGRNWESKPINRRIDMEAGETFLIQIKPASDCYCYIVVYDLDRQISVIYNEGLRAEQEINIGPIEVDNKSGTDTLYVIMSLERQTKLETLITNFNNNPGSMQYADDLRTEVINLQTRAAGLGEPSHAFILGGGSTRGGSEEYINRYTEKNMYVRPIMIRH